MPRLPATAALLAALLWTACGTSGPDAGTQVEPRDVHLVSEGGGVPFLTGTLVNVTDEAIPSVQVQVHLYDDANTKVDELIFPVRNLAPGVETPFREAVNSRAAFTQARIVSVLRL